MAASCSSQAAARRQVGSRGLRHEYIVASLQRVKDNLLARSRMHLDHDSIQVGLSEHLVIIGMPGLSAELPCGGTGLIRVKITDCNEVDRCKMQGWVDRPASHLSRSYKPDS
jgi:hypothetical protein